MNNAADRTPFPGLALYSMSKPAPAGMTRGPVRELGPRGITVNLVHPAAYLTGASVDVDGGFTA
ncbi:SDR family oxidoreductase [Streptomyces seoulensis]|uniref:SDR family oxidoreductase n=1 Tax=Streptomyces seoulensis TaxID=73044 RepID=UPI00365832DF